MDNSVQFGAGPMQSISSEVLAAKLRHLTAAHETHDHIPLYEVGNCS